MVRWSDSEPWLIVLIETYWNVKYKYSYDGERTLTVLIETYWNVK